MWNKFFDLIKQLKDLGVLTSSNFLGMGISAIFWFYLASLIKVEQFGEIQYFMGVVGIAYVISAFGSPSTITVYAGKKIKIHSTLFLISISIAIISAVVLFSIFNRIDIGLLVLGLIIYDMVLYFLVGENKFALYSKYFLMQKTLLVLFGLGFYYYFGFEGIIFGIVTSHIPFIIPIIKIIQKQKIDFLILKEKKEFVFNNYLISLIGGFRGDIDKILIMPILGLTLLGNYALAMQIHAVLMIFSNILLKYMMSQDSRGNSNSSVRKIAVFSSIGISVFGITIVPILVSFFFPKYIEVIDAIQIASISVFPGTIGYVYISKFLGNEQSRIVLIGRIIALALTISGMLVLPNFLGINGAVLVIVLASTVQTIFFITMNKKINGQIFPK